jgi:hypothetical protein
MQESQNIALVLVRLEGSKNSSIFQSSRSMIHMESHLLLVDGYTAVMGDQMQAQAGDMSGSTLEVLELKPAMGMVWVFQ